MVNKSYKHFTNSNALGNYANNIKHFKRLKDILEAHTTNSKSLEFQNNLRTHQKQMNYVMEYERLKGVLEGQAHRLPPISKEQLEDRMAKLKKAIKKKLDDVK